MRDVINAILLIFFGSSNPIAVGTMVLYIAGIWRILQKSGLKGWWALIPGAREYQLSRCAGREPEGRIFSVVTVVLIAIAIITNVLIPIRIDAMTDEEVAASLAANHGLTFLAVATIPLVITEFIYGIRVWSGLVNVYGVRRRWMWLCLIDETRMIPALIWGFSKRYQPAWQVEVIKAEMERLATSGTATVMDEGLSVNLTERTATEFFQKKTLLRDIHMSIPQGHMVLLLGGSGAGKTTYLNAINGYEKARAEVLLNGSNMYTQYKHMQHEVGFVPQSEMMRGKDTVINTLLDAAKLRLPKDVSGKQRRERVNEVMDIFGLQPVKNNLVEKLSGGQKKRLSISIEFISNPSLFILAGNADVQARLDNKITVKTSLGKVLDIIGEENVKNFLEEKAAAASYNPAFEYTAANVTNYWYHLALFVFAFALLATITLEFIDKDKR